MFFQWTLLCVRLLLPSILIRAFSFLLTPSKLLLLSWHLSFGPLNEALWVKSQRQIQIGSPKDSIEFNPTKIEKKFQKVNEMTKYSLRRRRVIRKEKAQIQIEGRSSLTHSSVTGQTSPPLSSNKIFVKLYFQPLCHFSECFVVWCVKRRECNVTSKEY